MENSNFSYIAGINGPLFMLGRGSNALGRLAATRLAQRLRSCCLMDSGVSSFSGSPISQTRNVPTADGPYEWIPKSDSHRYPPFSTFSVTYCHTTSMLDNSLSKRCNQVSSLAAAPAAWCFACMVDTANVCCFLQCHETATPVTIFVCLYYSPGVAN